MRLSGRAPPLRWIASTDAAATKGGTCRSEKRAVMLPRLRVSCPCLLARGSVQRSHTALPVCRRSELMDIFDFNIQADWRLTV